MVQAKLLQLVQELSEYGISVNELIPGPVNPEMRNESMKDSRSAFSINDLINKMI